jgi:tRNA/rRNA methyltransferase
MALDNFAFVLFRPKSAGNVGASAMSDLRIVADECRQHIIKATDELRPDRHPENIAEIMAVHGRDVLAAATVHTDLHSALADRTLVVGTTARKGLYRSEARPIREAATELVRLSSANRVAVVFGPEDCGLTNQELKRCQRLLTIPTAPAYPSLNLAQAVMIVAYELMLAANAAPEIHAAEAWAPSGEVNAMLNRMAKALIAIGFLPAENPDHIMFALRAIVGRAGLRPRELDIMNGIARQILWFAVDGREILRRKQQAGEKFR